jgi:hypothetical protein
MKAKILVLLITLMLFAAPVLAEEPPAAPAEKPAVEAPVEKAEVPAAAPVEKASEAAKDEPKDDTASNIWNPSWWEIVGAILALIWGVIVTKTKLKDGKNKKITMAFEAAVQDTYTEFIRELKAGKADGKLTKEEVKQAQGMAWDKAKDILKTQGVDLGKEMLVEYGPVIVTKIVQLFKKKKD